MAKGEPWSGHLSFLLPILIEVATVEYKSPPYPPDYLPIVTFDTSTHNRLYDDGASEEKMALIRARRHVRVAGLSVEELFATPDPVERVELFKYAERVTVHPDSDTLMPHNVLAAALIREHYAIPWGFDWTRVNVRADSYHDELRLREYVADSVLAAEQRQEHRDSQKQFRSMFTSMRPELDKAFAQQGETRPLTFRDALEKQASASHQLPTTIGKILYEHIIGAKVNRYRVWEFISVCPPFRALVYGHMMAWYDLAVRDLHKGERFTCGQADLYMATYLPYCDEFVTDEKKGEQARCLEEIVVVAGLNTNILTFDEFYAGLLKEQR